MTDASDQTSSITKMIEQRLELGEVALVVTKLTGPGPIGAKLLVRDSGMTFGTLGDEALDTLVTNYASRFLASRDETRMISASELDPNFPDARETNLLFERLQPAPRLVICGAGHVGASLARLAAFAGYHTTLIDDRADFLKRERFPEEQIELLVADDWRTALLDAIGNGRGVSVAVVTRGHNEDEQCLRVVVDANPDYVGLIGSKRRTSIVIDRLRESGIDEAQLKNIHAPIGLDIGAVTPEEVALAIMAEIVAERRGGTGIPLSQKRAQKTPK
ncbi:MAG TPA: XdhC/CoxI family protein [Pyrinomonadaceae bacterium]|jgi:xanthine dehydrogenase accessory factor|nr:XdhC/CoxI family protein [Pyrinomonadaceae bacterium]